MNVIMRMFKVSISVQICYVTITCITTPKLSYIDLVSREPVLRISKIINAKIESALDGDKILEQNFIYLFITLTEDLSEKNAHVYKIYVKIYCVLYKYILISLFIPPPPPHMHTYICMYITDFQIKFIF